MTSSILPRCEGCGTDAGRLRHNHLIGGWWCERCDRRITMRDPELEAKYNRHIAALKRRPREVET